MFRNEEDSVIIDAIDFNSYDTFNLWLTNFEDEVPVPKTYTVDIPGGDGSIDLTEALSGDIRYECGTHTFEFTYPNLEGFEQLKTQVKNLLHGRKFDYRLSWDPEYTFTGRFTVSDDANFNEAYGMIGLEIEYQPYKLKTTKTEMFNVSDGFVAHLSSGRKRVKPVFEFSDDTIVVFEGKRYVIPEGSHTVNDVWFKQGTNEVTFVLAGLQSHITHGEMAQFTNEQLAAKKYWQIYKGIEKHYVSLITVEGTETPLTGVINFTAADELGNTFSQALDLGDVKLARLGEEYDTITIKDDVAIIRKIVDVAEDGTKTLLPLPQSVTLDFPALFSNQAEIVNLTHDTAANVTYNTDSMNIELTMRKATHTDYMAGGEYAMTNAEMKAYNHARLTMINTGTQEVTQERQESVYVQYEWRDL